MKKYLFIFLFFGATNLFSQQQMDSTSVETIKSLETKVNQQQNDIEKLYSELNKEYRTYRIVKEDLNQTIIVKQQEVIDSLNTLIENNNQKLTTVNNQLDSKIQKTGESTNSQIAKLDSSVEKNRLHWIIATLVILLFGSALFWFLGKRMRADKTEVENQIQASKTDVETQIKNTKTALEEESVKLDNKLVEVLTKQLEVIKTEKPITNNTAEQDHSLVLKVADRLTAMETNHYRMDPNTKGLKQLVRSVKSIKENYLSSGYEIVEMMGQEYKEGLNVTANFIPSEEIETGKRVITRIIKPQVNFNGKMIQAAQIEVSVGE